MLWNKSMQPVMQSECSCSWTLSSKCHMLMMEEKNQGSKSGMTGVKGYIQSCLVPQFLQNLEFILSLEPQAKQNLVSDSDVLLTESFFGGVTSLLEREDGIPLYISVTAPEGLKVSSISGIKSESSFLMLPLLVFS